MHRVLWGLVVGLLALSPWIVRADSTILTRGARKRVACRQHRLRYYGGVIQLKQGDGRFMPAMLKEVNATLVGDKVHVRLPGWKLRQVLGLGATAGGELEINRAQAHDYLLLAHQARDAGLVRSVAQAFVRLLQVRTALEAKQRLSERDNAFVQMMLGPILPSSGKVCPPTQGQLDNAVSVGTQKSGDLPSIVEAWLHVRAGERLDVPQCDALRRRGVRETDGRFELVEKDETRPTPNGFPDQVVTRFGGLGTTMSYVVAAELLRKQRREDTSHPGHSAVSANEMLRLLGAAREDFAQEEASQGRKKLKEIGFTGGARKGIDQLTQLDEIIDRLVSTVLVERRGPHRFFSGGP